MIMKTIKATDAECIQEEDRSCNTDVCADACVYGFWSRNFFGV